MLDEFVILELKENIKKYINTDAISTMIQVEKENEAEKRSVGKCLKNMQKEMKAKEDTITSLYLDKVKGIISEEQFTVMNQLFLNEREALVQKVSLLEEKLTEINASKDMLHTLDEEKAKHDAITQYLEINEVTREIIVELIDFIVVENLSGRNNKRIEIHWKF
jgi:hypothetical protein